MLAGLPSRLLAVVRKLDKDTNEGRDLRRCFYFSRLIAVNSLAHVIEKALRTRFPSASEVCIVIKASIKFFLQRSCTIDLTIKIFIKES
jgi:hypothetical protein